MTRRNIIILISVAVLIIALATIVIINNREPSTTEPANELQSISVSEVTRSVFYAPQYVAINKGFFKEKGIEIELTTGQGADAVMTSVLSNQSDIGFARTRSINICI